MGILTSGADSSAQTDPQDRAATTLKGIYKELGRIYGMLYGVTRNRVAVAYSVADSIRDRIDQISGTDMQPGQLKELTRLADSIDALIETLRTVNLDELEQQVKDASAPQIGSAGGVTVFVTSKASGGDLEEGY